MAITYEIDKWLRESYEYHCFVSWPHIANRDFTVCARAVRTAIQEGLALSLNEPKVFLDESEVKGGDEWEKKIRRALCRSVCMVAICAPIYFRPEHLWCGLEWAAMQHLSSTRLRGRDFQAIIPVIFRTSDPLPPAVRKLGKPHDISKVTTQGRRFNDYPAFRVIIQAIIARIEEISEELWRSQSKADCELFQFPNESAFSDYNAPAQPYPLVG